MSTPPTSVVHVPSTPNVGFAGSIERKCSPEPDDRSAYHQYDEESDLGTVEVKSNPFSRIKLLPGTSRKVKDHVRSVKPKSTLSTGILRELSDKDIVSHQERDVLVQRVYIYHRVW